MSISCRPFINVWLARTGFSIWSLWHVSLFSLCFGHQSWILAWDVASLGCHLGVIGFIIHIVHERTKQKGDMGLISCEPPFFLRKRRGLEEGKGLLQATQPLSWQSWEQSPDLLTPAVTLFPRTHCLRLMWTDMIFYEMLGRKPAFMRTLFPRNCLRCLVYLGSFYSHSASARALSPWSHWYRNKRLTDWSVRPQSPDPFPQALAKGLSFLSLFPPSAFHTLWSRL